MVGYVCKSGMIIFKWRVTWNYDDSSFKLTVFLKAQALIICFTAGDILKSYIWKLIEFTKRYAEILYPMYIMYNYIVHIQIHWIYLFLHKKCTAYSERNVNKFCRKLQYNHYNLLWTQNLRQGKVNVRKVNCSFVYSAYILKPVLSGRNL